MPRRPGGSCIGSVGYTLSHFLWKKGTVQENLAGLLGQERPREPGANQAGLRVDRTLPRLCA